MGRIGSRGDERQRGGGLAARRGRTVPGEGLLNCQCAAVSERSSPGAPGGGGRSEWEGPVGKATVELSVGIWCAGMTSRIGLPSSQL